MTSPVRRALAAAATLAVVLAGGLLIAPSPAQARTLAPCHQLGLKKEIRQADVVFRGVVEKARAAHGKGTKRTRTYKVHADRVYRSSLVTDSVVVTAEVGKPCPPPTLRQHRRYIFFVTEDGSRLIATAATAPATHRLTSQVVARLGSGVQPRPAPPATAQFTKVADASPPGLTRLLAPGAALVIISLLGLVVVGRMGRRTT